MIAMASGFYRPDPRPIPSARGARVKIAISADMTIGRSRARPAWRSALASIFALPSTSAR
jgi:hypothetical protein